MLAATGWPFRHGRGSDLPDLGARPSLASSRCRLYLGHGRPGQFVRGARGCGTLGADAHDRRSPRCQVGLHAGLRLGLGSGEPHCVLGLVRCGLAFHRLFCLSALARGPRWGQRPTES